MILIGRKTLTETERRIAELLLAGDDPVLDLLRRQLALVSQVDRIRLDGKSLAQGPHLSIAFLLEPKPRKLSVAALARGAPWFADLGVQVGGAHSVASLRVKRGYVSSLQIWEHSGRVPNALRRELKDWGYKTCGHWDDPFCGDLPVLGMKQRPTLDLADRHPPRRPGARAPRWMRDDEDNFDPAEPAGEAELAGLRESAGVVLPEDLLAVLQWSNGLELEGVDLLAAEEMYFLDESVTSGRKFVIATDAGGNVFALDLDQSTPKGEYPIVYFSHDPFESRHVSRGFRSWFRTALRGEIG